MTATQPNNSVVGYAYNDNAESSGYLCEACAIYDACGQDDDEWRRAIRQYGDDIADVIRDNNGAYGYEYVAIGENDLPSEDHPTRCDHCDHPLT
jgi:hypothetical protein